MKIGFLGSLILFAPVVFLLRLFGLHLPSDPSWLYSRQIDFPRLEVLQAVAGGCMLGPILVALRLLSPLLAMLVACAVMLDLFIGVISTTAKGIQSAESERESRFARP